MNKVIWFVKRNRESGDYLELNLIKTGGSYELHYYTSDNQEVYKFKTYTLAFNSLIHLLEDLA